MFITLLLNEFLVKSLAEFFEFCHAIGLDYVLNLVFAQVCNSSTPSRIREDVDECRTYAAEEVVGGVEKFIGFAGEAHDDVDAEEHVISNSLAYVFNLLFEKGRVVVASHLTQNLVATTLERNVEMGEDFSALRYPVHDLVADEVRLD